MRHFIFHTIKETFNRTYGYTTITLSVNEIIPDGLYDNCVRGPKVISHGTFKYRTGATYGDLTEVKNHLARTGVIDSKYGEFGEEQFRYFKRYNVDFPFTIEGI